MRLAIAAVLTALTVCPAWADDTLTLQGPSGPSVSLARSDLDALPAGPSQPHYAGPTLWSVLQRAGLVSPDFHGRARLVLTVTGNDGYSVALALAEIDPEFEGKDVLVALRRDDAPLHTPRLDVPGDKRAGRSVRDVVRIELSAPVGKTPG